MSQLSLQVTGVVPVINWFRISQTGSPDFLHTSIMSFLLVTKCRAVHLSAVLAEDTEDQIDSSLVLVWFPLNGLLSVTPSQKTCLVTRSPQCMSDHFHTSNNGRMRHKYPIPFHDPETHFLGTADLLDNTFTPFKFNDLGITEPWFLVQHRLDEQFDVTEVVWDRTTGRWHGLLTLVLLLLMQRWKVRCSLHGRRAVGREMDGDQTDPGMRLAYGYFRLSS